MLIGEIRLFAGELSPVNLNRLRRLGWMPCDGRVLSENRFKRLFDAVQDNFHQPEVELKPGRFQIPDLRGRTAMGAGQGIGLTERVLGEHLGQEQVVLSVEQMPSHSHAQQTARQPDVVQYTKIYSNNATRQAVDHLRDRVETAQSGSNRAHPNMQPSLGLHYVIRYALPRGRTEADYEVDESEQYEDES